MALLWSVWYLWYYKFSFAEKLWSEAEEAKECFNYNLPFLLCYFLYYLDYLLE